MITVFETPLAFISASSVSGVASRSGTLAPGANGYSGSCFQTCTCGSRMRYAFTKGAIAAPRSSARRDISSIDPLELIDDIRAAFFVAGARTSAGNVVVDHQPSFKSDRFKHAMAAGK